MPLDWFFRPGVVLDFTDKPDGYMFEPEDLQEKLDAIGYTLKPYDIVLISESQLKGLSFKKNMI